MTLPLFEELLYEISGGDFKDLRVGNSGRVMERSRVMGSVHPTAVG